MRKLSRIALCIVSLFLAIGCTKNKEYTNVIPSDASFVTSINLKSLIDKSGIANKENHEIKQKMMDALLDCNLIDDDQTILLMAARHNTDLIKVNSIKINDGYSYFSGLEYITGHRININTKSILSNKSQKALSERIKWKTTCIRYLIRQFKYLKGVIIS